MPKLKKTGEGPTKVRKLPKRQFEFKEKENRILKLIGRKIRADLLKKEKPAEWLAFSVEMSRSTLMAMIAGQRNPRLLTLNAIAEGLGYDDIFDFMAAVKTQK